MGMPNDIISDTLIRIKNALMAMQKTTRVKRSKLVENILKILKEEGYIEDYTFPPDNPYEIEVKLKYYNGKPVITHIERVSKPSRRVYTGYKKIPTVLNNLGIVILTTPKGVMTGKEAKKLKVGGEIICYVW